jgi:hypothetical protein
MIQANLNAGVPKYKSFLKEKEIQGGRELTEEEKADKEQKRLALSKEESDYRGYCKELKHMAWENK